MSNAAPASLVALASWPDAVDAVWGMAFAAEAGALGDDGEPGGGHGLGAGLHVGRRAADAFGRGQHLGPRRPG